MTSIVRTPAWAFIALLLLGLALPASAQSVSLRQVRGYRALALGEGCVVNAVLFEAFLRARFPGAWTQRITVPDKISGGGHELVAFEAEENIHIWDPRCGVFRPGNVTRETVSAVLARSYTPPARQTLLFDEAPDEVESACAALRQAGFDATAIRYQRTDYVVFVEGDRLNLYRPGFGTIRAKLLANNLPRAVQVTLAQVVGGDGAFTFWAGQQPAWGQLPAI